ncbi:hypothetical protein Pmar_PMAR002515 [Perkinsus marinus ATCC 50983]|uniref:Fibronectin type-III domain-containing protein n=1 Tax=Perkinsus marinus (strain ATCC 50983 / TXsc) TaxID=423536 RepID=C5LTK3_PERM5|nr:hypothetical protein Pmar_PMAR002515 [Perkinsus marinus ATCC 50983]EEQ99938.1 hypothetical protein Pmar_PMAR002515 [Perkinsus marinus ATCC 50983]|eukprot:XP_002767221.1 hypothetical protein Pmar_PMAR002515 [Perkinsus marinus ATCC 50983]
MTTDEPNASTPDKVTDLTDTGSTSNSVALNWTAPADNGAMILRYIISEGDNTYTVDGHDTSYTTPFSDGVSVSWSKANNPQCDLPVTAYRVIDDDGNELCQVAANDDDGALWCDVTGLQPSTSYNIRVQAKNSAAGWSTKSSSPVKMSTIAS